MQLGSSQSQTTAQPDHNVELGLVGLVWIWVRLRPRFETHIKSGSFNYLNSTRVPTFQ